MRGTRGTHSRRNIVLAFMLFTLGGRWRACAGALLFSIVGEGAVAWSTLDDWALVVATQIKSKAPLPVLSNYGAGLNLADAYAVQRGVAEQLGDREKIAGFRVSLTRPRGQVEFNVREPVSGVIFTSGLLRGPTTLKLHDFKQLMVAPGLGFVLKSAITTPLTDLSQVETQIGAVVPVIEFSDYRFDASGRMRGEDFVANNAAFARLLVGRPFESIDPTAINGVVTEMARGDAVVDRGRAINVMGNQYTALYWLINQLLKQGWQLPASTLLVTGALSDPLRGESGHYSVRFGAGSTLAFEIER